MESKGYNVLGVLGSGSFGQVFKVSKIGSTMEYAIKVIDKNRLNHPKLIEYINSEIAIMKKINHPNILKCVDSFESPNAIFIVINFCNGGDLADYLSTHGKLGEGESIYFLKQILNGFAELLQHQIMHRDFKPENVFMHNGNLILGDFGLAKNGIAIGMTVAGTPMTSAPEVLLSRGDTVYTNKVDIWSIGVTLYKMLFGQYPWRPLTGGQLEQFIVQQEGDRLPFPNNTMVSEEMKNLLRRMIKKEPHLRIGWKELFNHPVLKCNYDFERECKNIRLDSISNEALVDLLFSKYSKLNF